MHPVGEGLVPSRFFYSCSREGASPSPTDLCLLAGWGKPIPYGFGAHSRRTFAHFRDIPKSNTCNLTTYMVKYTG